MTYFWLASANQGKQKDLLQEAADQGEGGGRVVGGIRVRALWRRQNHSGHDAWREEKKITEFSPQF